MCYLVSILSVGVKSVLLFYYDRIIYIKSACSEGCFCLGHCIKGLYWLVILSCGYVQSLYILFLGHIQYTPVFHSYKIALRKHTIFYLSYGTRRYRYMDIYSVLNNSAVSQCKCIWPGNSAIPSLCASRRSDILYEGPFDILITNYVYPALNELLRLLRRVPAAVLFLDVRGIFVEGPINTLHNLCYVQRDVSSYEAFFTGSYNDILV